MNREEAIAVVEGIRDDLRAGEISGDGYYKSDERAECADALDLLLTELEGQSVEAESDYLLRLFRDGLHARLRICTSQTRRG